MSHLRPEFGVRDPLRLRRPIAHTAAYTGDTDLAPYFVDVDMKSLRQHQFEMISAATGGPVQYTGREMGSAHADLGIAPEHFDRVVMHLVASLGDAGVAEGDIADVAAALGPLKPDVVSV